ncbi:hypothetical protein [Qipengyuania vesicularis]|uniref:hypothetical protein n=1 Tax=Qipengyuania vesicularis TaxID=2867232 RepID=UPI001C86A64E|nr:hypothetical protein [Qipengyuania vesicularis]MBX7527412.1 hypothetical protein [Qipengyuania vesicularis]
MTGRGRLVGSLLALAFVILALFSGLDRMSQSQPGVARLVPPPFRAEAALAETSAAIARGDGELATLLAAEAIASSPLDPRGSSLWAAARLAAGDREAAIAGFGVADGSGLRSPLVQAYFFDRALAAGEVAEAGERLDILLRVHPSLVRQGYFFAALEASDTGRTELARRLLEAPSWSAAYLSAWEAGDDVLRARAAFLSRGEGGVELGCGRIEPMMRELARRNFRAEAQRLAQVQCPDRTTAQAIADPGFDAVNGENAFGWQRHGSGDVRVTSIGDGDRQVELQNRSGVTRLVLSQSVALEEGEYRVFASVSGRGSEGVVASLDCGEARRPARSGGSLGRGQLLRARGCDNAVLGIWLRPGSGVVRLDAMRIERVGDPGVGQPSSSAE